MFPSIFFGIQLWGILMSPLSASPGGKNKKCSPPCVAHLSYNAGAPKGREDTRDNFPYSPPSALYPTAVTSCEQAWLW